MERRFREALLEYTEVGGYLKVTAMDPDTLTEVSVVGPPVGSKELLTRTVLDKLDYVLAKEQETKARARATPVMVRSVSYGPSGAMRKVR